MISGKYLVVLIPGAVGATFDGASWIVQFADGGLRAATAAEMLAAAKSAAITANRAEARRRIEQRYPLWRQQSAVLGVYPEAYAAQMATDIAAVVAAENTAADLIDAATTEAEVAAVTVNWPVI